MGLSTPGPSAAEGVTPPNGAEAREFPIMAGFKKKNPDEGTGEDSGGKPTAEPIKTDPRKARPWFERAGTLAESRQYDYAIECYIGGLKFDPGVMDQHDALHEVALRRKVVGGGKPAGFMEKMKRGSGKTPLDKMLAAEYLWSKDPLSPSLAVKVMQHAVEADLGEVAYWAGDMAMKANSGAKRPSAGIYQAIRELYKHIGAFDKAVEACRLQIGLNPDNAVLLRELKDLETERTMDEGHYDDQEGDFRKSILDEEHQKNLERDQSLSRAQIVIDETIQKAKSEYEDSPEDIDALRVYVDALLRKESDESENLGVKLLGEAFERSGQYRFKQRIGDVKIRQYGRRLRALRQKYQQQPDNAELRHQMEHLLGEQLRFELAEFAERAKNYPTDMGIRFELGVRELRAKDFDSAIAHLQEAQSDPGHRVNALRFLGEAFTGKEWFDEAVDTLRRGIETHPIADDALGTGLRYDLGRALQAKAARVSDAEAAREALGVISGIAQLDINYRDVRQRVEALRQLVGELEQKQT